jgi:nucleotide-binding universal stress UspA family protein/nitrite reductase/ring-hydroxylating ferredoxin subunit
LTAYSRILVGTDGSPTAKRAESAAARLAKALGAELILLHVGETEVLEEAAERARAFGVEARLERRSGEVPATIMDVAVELLADLLVIGDHGMGPARRFEFAGIPAEVAHNSPIDILVVRTSDPGAEHFPYTRVLIATDGSLTAHQAARHGQGLAEALGATVSLIYVGDGLIGEIVLRDAASRLGGDDITQIVVKGNAGAQITRVAADYDLVVVGNKGMTGARRLGRKVVPDKVAHDAPSDVLIAKTVSRSFFDLRPGEGAVVELEGDKVAAYLHDDGTSYLLSARCQHMGCIVDWNSRAKTWDCPCHGSRYQYDGAIINGPTTKPLPPVEAGRPGPT